MRKPVANPYLVNLIVRSLPDIAEIFEPLNAKEIPESNNVILLICDWKGLFQVVLFGLFCF